MKLEEVVQVVGSESKIARWVPQAGGMRKNWFEILPEYKIQRCFKRKLETICAIQGTVPSLLLPFTPSFRKGSNKH